MQMSKLNKKKVKINNLILFIVLILVILAIVLYFILKGKKLDTNSTQINELYSYLGSNDLEVCNGLNIYSENEINYDKIDNNIRICNAYSLLDIDETSIVKIDKTKKNNTCSINENIKFATDNYEDDICTITKIESEKINEQYKKMYGKEIENYEQFQLNPTTICYYDEEGYYYCGLSESFTYTIGAEPQTYRTIKKANKKDDEIIIFDYFMKVINNECFTTYDGDNKNNNCSNIFNEDTNVDYDFLKKYGTLYKHTFKESNGSYYWVKSEPVK